MSHDMTGSFEERLAAIRDRVTAACARAGRSPDDVLLLPVTKGVDPDSVSVAARCGLGVFGESKVQEARHKIGMCPGHLSWHMIGHLQSNKVREAVHLFSMVHSIDSLDLLRQVAAASDNAGKTMPVCLEVNVSGEGSKYGLAVADVEGVVAAGNDLGRIEVRGLMTIPPVAEDPGASRPYFRKLRELRDRLRASTGVDLNDLSMGMSNDFEIAIEEGATVVRVGTILFGKREVRKP
ncbi:MAG: YggS family pyridoxal phosphate-dependent enzyme [bacterium]